MRWCCQQQYLSVELPIVDDCTGTQRAVGDQDVDAVDNVVDYLVKVQDFDGVGVGATLGIVAYHEVSVVQPVASLGRLVLREVDGVDGVSEGLNHSVSGARQRQAA